MKQHATTLFVAIALSLTSIAQPGSPARLPEGAPVTAQSVRLVIHAPVLQFDLFRQGR